MKHNSLFFVFALAMVLFSCGPAAEDRQEMHHRAKVFQDSIANFIRMSMNEAATPGPNAVPAQVQPTAAATSTAAGTPTPQTPNVGVNQTPGQPYTK